jgi:hypothetical protein
MRVTPHDIGRTITPWLTHPFDEQCACSSEEPLHNFVQKLRLQLLQYHFECQCLQVLS